MDDEPLDELELDRFWNDLLADRPTDGGYQLDSAAMDAVRRFKRLTRTPSPDPSHTRVGHAVDAEIRRLGKEFPMNGTVSRSFVPLAAPAAPARAAVSTSAWRAQWVIAPLATAALVALLVVTAALGWIAFGSPRSRDGDHGRVPAAVIAPATPTPAPTVLRARVGSVAQGPTWTAIERNTLAPGAEAVMTTEVILVEQGGLAIEAAVAGEVVRANGSTERIAAGTALTLGVGDGAAFSVADAGTPGLTVDGPVRLRNPGTVPAIFVDAVVGSMGAKTAFYRGYTSQTLLQVDSPPVGFPATVTLGRATLGPGEGITAPTGGVVLVCSVDGSGVLSSSGEGGYRNIGSAPKDVYVLTIAPLAGETAATPASSG